MKKIVLTALAATTAFIAMPAAAQTVTGTVTLTGSVAPKCSVNPGAASTFSASVNFGELSQANGTLRAGLAHSKNTITVQVGTSIAEAERQLILATFAHCGHNKERTAAALGIVGVVVDDEGGVEDVDGVELAGFFFGAFFLMTFSEGSDCVATLAEIFCPPDTKQAPDERSTSPSNPQGRR